MDEDFLDDVILRAALDLDPAAAGFSVVVYGHSHRPAMEWRDGVLYFNPGAAGHRRFDRSGEWAGMGGTNPRTVSRRHSLRTGGHDRAIGHKI